MRRIKPIKGINAVIRVPGSKSYTQRALIASALAGGRSVIRDALISEDTGHLIKALCLLGADIVEKEHHDLVVEGTGGKLVAPASALYLGNNGTGLRFLAGTVSLGHGTFVLDGNARMRQRPIQPLVDALNKMGVMARCIEANGCPPVEVRARGLPGGKTRLEGGLSSQYLSSLLLAAPYAERDTEIEVLTRLPSWPYIKLTLDVMAHFGVEVSVLERGFFCVEGLQTYNPREYVVEGDASSATYFMAAAAILGQTVKIPNINAGSLQGDLRFLDILEAMGCKVSTSGEGVQVTGPLSNHEELSFDLNDVPDMVPALAVVSAFRKGKTVLKNIGHLRVKESDRVAALTHELKKIGARADEKAEEMTVQGIAAHGAEIECYNDHRIAMSFAIAGLAIEGISIKDPDCVKKSFPDFWEKLESLG
ncbi:MAG: 3-phosphoshikimate 1-carboxyvinyltransferase [Desulfobacterales bacterium C00003060]|nr:MAG: 3-phosphoshikimate 1-carboxyvinyltransferase [Desulfobacterales bacterium S3730MH5]OEU78277.1 MAG: 3-phosphoshikimate 1-carboxyvinyltransferase [Desulfobacterales bacterium S5133MH4]OEU80080.1 MAG: 3-phosphoshikimate 1-carboxyvinyltransferase [Desulfobacterales bacterium C00003060]